MAASDLTDEQVEREIERLKQSPYVALARKEQRVRNQRRQMMYNLRALDKKGRELAKIGVTSGVLDVMARESAESDGPEDTPSRMYNALTEANKALVNAAIAHLLKEA